MEVLHSRYVPKWMRRWYWYVVTLHVCAGMCVCICDHGSVLILVFHHHRVHLLRLGLYLPLSHVGHVSISEREHVPLGSPQGLPRVWRIGCIPCCRAMTLELASRLFLWITNEHRCWISSEARCMSGLSLGKSQHRSLMGPFSLLFDWNLGAGFCRGFGSATLRWQNSCGRHSGASPLCQQPDKLPLRP